MEVSPKTKSMRNNVIIERNPIAVTTQGPGTWVEAVERYGQADK